MCPGRKIHDYYLFKKVVSKSGNELVNDATPVKETAYCIDSDTGLAASASGGTKLGLCRGQK